MVKEKLNHVLWNYVNIGKCFYKPFLVILGSRFFFKSLHLSRCSVKMAN